MSRTFLNPSPQNIKSKYCDMCEQVSNFLTMSDGSEICQECGYSNYKGPR